MEQTYWLHCLSHLYTPGLALMSSDSTRVQNRAPSIQYPEYRTGENTWLDCMLIWISCLRGLNTGFNDSADPLGEYS